MSREWFRARAKELGFDAVGFAAAPEPGQPFVEGERFREWLRLGYAGEMGYLERTVERRAQPDRLLAGIQSAVVLVNRYPGADVEPGPTEGRVAAYARGRDYHNVLGYRMKKLLRLFLRRFPGAQAYRSVDTGAVLERAWAVRAGLGWVGKNTMMLHPADGSYTLLAVLLVSLDLAEPSESWPVPVADQCGSCRLCLDACPTAAFPQPYVLDARRCISYLTIEQAGDLPLELRGALADHVFGCDVCQQVCPFNLIPRTTLDAGFGPPATPLHESLEQLLALDESGFAELTKGRPLARPGRDGLVRNACVAAGNSGDRSLVAPLVALLGDPSSMVRRHAAWALGELGGEAARAALAAAREIEADAATRVEMNAALARVDLES